MEWVRKKSEKKIVNINKQRPKYHWKWEEKYGKKDYSTIRDLELTLVL